MSNVPSSQDIESGQPQMSPSATKTEFPSQLNNEEPKRSLPTYEEVIASTGPTVVQCPHSSTHRFCTHHTNVCGTTTWSCQTEMCVNAGYYRQPLWLKITWISFSIVFLLLACWVIFLIVMHNPFTIDQPSGFNNHHQFPSGFSHTSHWKFHKSAKTNIIFITQ